ncbi:MAG: Zn-dependent hydrolase [Kiloniellales bacterium]|nr:Zn-dependent hydrolase [Kiloniellales bacterium]
MTDGDLSTLRIDGERLWSRLMEMARHGATEKGGVCRLTGSDEDKAGRDLFVQWCEAAGCTVTVDKIGNIFARRPGRPGREDSAGAVLAGSHLDSQPTGGRFDGVYGVLAALEVVETLNDHGVETEAPVEIAAWTNEEGARFAPAMLGSGVFAGVFELAPTLAIEDKAGKTLGEELARIGYAGEAEPGDRKIKAAFEVHIEQGPILEREEKTIGVVQGVQGMRWYDMIIEGQEAHAGPTPMEGRRDPFQGLMHLLPEIYAIANERAPWGRATCGDIAALPGSRNTVPGRLVTAVDLRHPDQDTLVEMDRALHASVERHCAALGLTGRVECIWDSPAVAFDPACIEAVRAGVAATGHPAMDIVSGAGHDSVYLSRIAPVGMIFVPCEGGLSHNEAENATPEDIAAGCDVLLHAVLAQAGT